MKVSITAQIFDLTKFRTIELVLDVKQIRRIELPLHTKKDGEVLTDDRRGSCRIFLDHTSYNVAIQTAVKLKELMEVKDLG